MKDKNKNSYIILCSSPMQLISSASFLMSNEPNLKFSQVKVCIYHGEVEGAIFAITELTKILGFLGPFDFSEEARLVALKQEVIRKKFGFGSNEYVFIDNIFNKIRETVCLMCEQPVSIISRRPGKYESIFILLLSGTRYYHFIDDGFGNYAAPPSIKENFKYNFSKMSKFFFINVLQRGEKTRKIISLIICLNFTKRLHF